MLNFLKGTFRFEVIHSDSLESEVVTSPEALINYVIGANNHLIRTKETGWIYAEKFKDSKKGTSLLYALKIELPLYEDNPYFDQLLSPFYTKKKQPFEEVLLPIATEKTENNSNGQPEIPAELKALATAGNDILDSKDSEEFIHEVIEKTSDQLSDETLQIEQAENQQLIDQLMYQLEMKQEEIDSLKQKEQLQSASVTTPEPLSIDEIQPEPLLNQEEKKTYPGLSLDSVNQKTEIDTRSLVVAPGSLNAVNDVLALVKEEFSSRLSAFVEEETEKINAEIKELDTRDLINADITKRIDAEKQQASETEQHLLETERDHLLKEEQERHQAALAEIERSYVDKITQKRAELTTLYEEKLRVAIAAEYERQSEQLSRILQGKKDELELKQREMNEGLKENFSQVLASFNATHEKVIENVEKQKLANQPIDFLSHKKVASN